MGPVDLTDLRDAVWRANQAIVRAGLVTLSFGNASGIDRAAGIMVIKPSGVPYDELLPENLVAVALDDGRVLDGELRPSSDTPTHLALYRRYPRSGASSTLIRRRPWRGPRLGGRSRLLAPPMPIISTARSL